MIYHLILAVYYVLILGGVFSSSFPVAANKGLGWLPVFFVASVVWPLWVPPLAIHGLTKANT